MIYQGFLDEQVADQIRGWAYNPLKCNDPVEVDIYANGQKIDTALADIFRLDLQNAGKGNGCHGFKYVLPIVYQDAFIEVKIHDTEFPLPSNIDDTPFFSAQETERIRIREKVAGQYLRGEGIEIGALHNPLPVPAGTIVQYVDRFDVPILCDFYPEIPAKDFVPVDIVDDGEHLTQILDASLDFVIASSFIEHTQNPLLTIENILRVLRKKGTAFITIPDKRYTFDATRPIHGFDHIYRDYLNGPEASRRDHYVEWVRHVEKFFGDEAFDQYVEERMAQNYSIHFHVWTIIEVEEMVQRLKKDLHFPFEVVLARPNVSEAVLVLRKI